VTTLSHARLLLSGLQAGLAGSVIGPDDPDYDEARQVFFPAFDRRPAAIVRPVDAEEVAYVVALARETGLDLAVRSGGHSLAGHGITDGGIVLDLSRLKAIEIDADRRVAWAETGLTAGEMTTAAAAHGLAVPFGDAAPVGIGGLTLGGGVGYLARKHGLTIDSLLAAELVTADGQQRRVDADEDPDLFWAIRGGGGNFGVATRFLFRLHPVDVVTGGMLILPATAETIAGFTAAAEEAPDEVSTVANVLAAPPVPFVPAEHHGRLVVMAMIAHAGPVDESEQALAPFRALAPPIADLLRPMRYPEMFPTEEPPRQLAVGRTTFMDALDRDDAGEILDRLQPSTALVRAVQLRVLGGAVARIDPDATAFAHRRRRIMVNVGAMYAKPEEGPSHEAWARATAEALRQGEDGAYVNFVGDEGEERVRAAYPGRTWERLAEVKRRYDPDNLFRLNQNVPPAERYG
jgi:FAD/FMN-containing dehydrogenase